MKSSRPFLEGTIILILASLCARCIGFFNRIYLSHVIGAHEMGIFQLIFPIYIIGFSLCFQGFDTTLSKLVSSIAVKKEEESNLLLLDKTLKFTITLSLLFVCFMELFSKPICIFFFHETRCIPCLRVALLALPFVGIKGALHSYSTGLGKPGLYAISLCIEQVIRVASIFLISSLLYSMLPIPALIAVFGMVLGEISSCIFTVFSFRSKHPNFRVTSRPKNYFPTLLKLGIPLTCNQLCVTVLSSIETILIPLTLALFYEDKHQAISTYGIMTGMALPFILFPATITNSLSTMLIPKVSETYAKGNLSLLQQVERKSILLSLVIGLFSFTIFHQYGRHLGHIVFHEAACGSFLQSMSFLCPFLYLSGTLVSILNGLGKTKITLLHNVISLSLRIAFILFVVPMIGINGYFLGLLLSTMLQVILNYKSMLNF